MQNDRPYAIPLCITYIPVMSKTFDRPKLDEDMEVGIRGLYQDHGYFKVVVNVTGVEDGGRQQRDPGAWPVIGNRRTAKRTNIMISIEEGEQYRMGKLTFRSSDPDQGLVFKPEILARAFPLKEGDIFAADKIRKALDNFRKLYGEYGYIDFAAEPISTWTTRRRSST